MSVIKRVAAAVVVGLVGIFVFAIWRADRAGAWGKTHLLRAEHDLANQRVKPARLDLLAAETDFRKMHQDMSGFGVGQMMAVARVIPLLRVQVRAANTFGEIGVSLSRAGIEVVDAAEAIGGQSGQTTRLSDSMDKLRIAQASLHAGVKALDDATVRVRELNHYRLFGPLASAERQLSQRLVHVDGTAHSAEQGVAALIAFTGGGGPRRYLILSQNPDELRPTGGFIGSYGVFVANAGHIALDRFTAIEDWDAAHPDAVVPPDEVQSPFRFHDPVQSQGLGNVNALPDWPSAAQLGLKLWQAGGEDPVDGVVSFTPNFLARVLNVTGPVSVPSYGETVTTYNVVQRLDYYTHTDLHQSGTARKAFLSALGEQVMHALLEAPTSQWPALGDAVAKGFAARELLAWSTDPTVQSTIVGRGWDGTLPVTTGDFFFGGEFEYSAKNGGGLKRTIDHDVVLHPDGSARITTSIKIDNTEDPNPVTNNDPVTYLTVYGPAGAVLNEASDPPMSAEPALGGHPAYGWLKPLVAHAVATVNVVWDVPALAERTSGGWQYALRWMHVVDNTADVVHVAVHLPPHARWTGAPPPSEFRLSRDLAGSWSYRL